jgi:hypothetical protein
MEPVIQIAQQDIMKNPMELALLVTILVQLVTIHYIMVVIVVMIHYISKITNVRKNVINISMENPMIGLVTHAQ